MTQEIEDDGLAAFAHYPGVQYRPSSPMHGDDFVAIWCKACARCKGPGAKPLDNCEILASSYTDQGAKEWRMVNGLRSCMSFVPAPRDEEKNRTRDMF